MIATLAIALTTLALGGAAALWWATHRIAVVDEDRNVAVKEAAEARIELATSHLERDRAVFESRQREIALRDQEIRTHALEETIADVLADPLLTSAGLRADDVAGRLRRRIAAYRAGHPVAAGDPLPADASAGAVPGGAAATRAGTVGDLPR